MLVFIDLLSRYSNSAIWYGVLLLELRLTRMAGQFPALKF